jgi:competence protein ComEC
MKVIKFPALNITLCVVLGILASNEIKPDIISACLYFSLFFLPFLLFYGLSISRRKFQLPFGISTYLLSFFLGFLIYALHYKPNHAHHYSNTNYNEKALVRGIISEKLKPNAFSYKYFLEVESVDKVNQTGKLLIILSKKDAEKEFQIGDIVLAYAKIKPIIRPHNPNQFDYAAHLEKKDVFNQLYLDNKNFKINGSEKELLYQLEKIRQKIVSYLEKEKVSENRLSIIKALFLGQRQNIEQQTLNQYSQAGAIHILAISGLHIGILLFFFKTLFKPLERLRYSRIFIPALLLLILWFFAILSGLSASVVRAAMMFSVVTFVLYLKRDTNIYNTLGISILFILLFEPNFIFDVGFQLSYSAVFAIVTIQPLFSRLWKSKNKIVQYFFDILTVSFAAQIGVLPLSIYYFHQFPGLFFLTNLVVIPLLTLILVTGLLTFILGSLGIPVSLLIHFLSTLVGLMNHYVAKIASFEDYIIKGIPFNSSLLLMSIITTISIVLWFKKPKFVHLTIALLTLLLFQLTVIFSWEFHRSANEFLILQYPKKTVLVMKIDNRISLWSNENEVVENYVIKNYLQGNFGEIDTISPVQNVMKINQTKLLIVDDKAIFSLPIKPDVVLLTQSPKLNLERLLTELQPKLIIADGSNFKTLVERWQKTCAEKNIPFHSTYEKGFYKIDLP